MEKKKDQKDELKKNKTFRDTDVNSELTRQIKMGAVGIMPTDTIYGLVCSALSKKAVAKVYQIKGRPADTPFIILISSIKNLEIFGVKPSKKQRKILNILWPNPISIILSLPKNNSFLKKFSYLHRGNNTLSFRWPKDKNLQKFIRESGPIIATSANIHGEPNAQNIKEAQRYFGIKVDFYEGNKQLRGKPSTLVKMTENDIYVLREGTYKLPKILKSKKVIKKKTWPKLFEEVLSGRKKFDLRLADFPAAPGDILELAEYDPKKKKFTGRTLHKKITFILKFKPREYPFASSAEVDKNGLQIFSLD